MLPNSVYGIIYKITNLIDQKVYIGQTTVGLDKRWQAHQKIAKNGERSTHLYDAMRCDGTENFQCEQVVKANSEEELNKAEIELIQQFSSFDRNFGYNIDLGGSGGTPRTQETKTKISQIHLGRVFTEEHKKALSIAHLGKSSPKKGIPLSEETKQKMKTSHWSRNGGIPSTLGKTWKESEEVRKKKSESQKGKKRGPYKKKLIEAENEDSGVGESDKPSNNG